jgi:hypothetical protein
MFKQGFGFFDNSFCDMRGGGFARYFFNRMDSIKGIVKEAQKKNRFSSQ